MKKIVMIFAAMAAVLSSCNKNEIEPVSKNDGKDIVLNIRVSNPGADDTKALIKEGWAAGDKISIWYNSNVQENPDLVIEYDANNTKWIQKTDATVSGNTPSTGTGKYAKALYNGKVKVASKDSYTYDGTTLTFNIANWKFLTEIQVVVYGDDIDGNNPSKYTLACDKFTPCTGYTVGSDGITASIGTKGAAVTGISNTDGVAFVFATADYSATAADYKFTLTDDTSTKVYKPNVAIESKTNKSAIKALTIESSKFAKAVPDGFVDLGLSSGIFWAEKNLGASKPEEYGSYFAWGATEFAYESLISNTFTFVGSRPNSYGGSGWDKSKGFNNVNAPYRSGSKYVKYTTGTGGDNKDKLESGDDVAYQTNNAWRMPTTEDFKELFQQCYAEWGTYNSVNGLIVYKVKSADDKGYAHFNSKMNQYSGSGNTWNTTTKTRPSYSTASDTFLFFPAAGYGGGTSLYDAGGHGYYWSSSHFTDDTSLAYTLNFDSGGVLPQGNGYRHYGFSVRPVSD